jgi:hypothetical protein
MVVRANGQGSTNEFPQEKINDNDRIIFKFRANFRVRAKDIPEMQRSLLEWASRWDINL